MIVEFLLEAARVIAFAAIGLAIGLLGLLAFGLVGLLVNAVLLRLKRSTPRGQAHNTKRTALIRGRMNRLAQPTLLLIAARRPGFSKLGGNPELPEGSPWPAGVGSPRSFLAQVDFTDARAAGGPDWLPEDGKIYAFYDDRRLGFSDLVQIVYSREPPEIGASPPAGVPAKLRFPERRVEFLRLRSIPSLDWLGIDVGELDDDVDLDELADLPNEAFGDELQHRIGGYPSEIQDEQMALSCERLRRGLDPHDGEEPTPALLRASKAWRLLLQIDSDPALKMNWGDSGMLYTFVREQDARAGDFSKTVTLFQCY